MERNLLKIRTPLRMAMAALLMSFLSVAAYADNVSYLDGDGVSHTADATRLTSAMLAGLDKDHPLSAGWYYVNDTIIVNNNIPIKSEEVNSVPTDVHIILTNRALLNVNGVIYKHWNYVDGALWIHSQTTDTLQMGTLTVNNSTSTILGDTINNEGYIYFQKQVDGCIQADSIVICGGNINILGPGFEPYVGNYGIRSTVDNITIKNARCTTENVPEGVLSAKDISILNTNVRIPNGMDGIIADQGSINISESFVNIDVLSLAMISNKTGDSIVVACSNIDAHGNSGMLSMGSVTLRESNINVSTSYDSPFTIGASGGKLTIDSSNVEAVNNSEYGYGLFCYGCDITDSNIELSADMMGINNGAEDVNISNSNVSASSNFMGIYSGGKVMINNGDTYIDASTYGIYAGDSIILDWTNDYETQIYSKSYSCPSGKLVFKNCFGLQSNSAVATATNVNNETLRAAYPLHITSANAATYYEGHYDVQMSRALVASIVEINIENNDTTLNFVPIAGGDYPRSETLSANTPVMITRSPYFASDTTSTYAMIYYSYYEQPYNSYPENILKGSDVDTLTYGGDKYYRLSVLNGVIGWYPANATLSPFNISAHQAWLPLSNEQVSTIKNESFYLTTDLYAKRASVLSVFEDEEETTGVKNAIGNYDSETNTWYDLNGRKLKNKPMQKGLYINGGKKVIFN